MRRSPSRAVGAVLFLALAAPAFADGFHSPLLRNRDPKKWAQTIRERLGLDRSDSAEEARPDIGRAGVPANQLLNVLRYLQRKNVLLREFPDFNYDKIPEFKSETESILIAMGADAVPVLLTALIADLRGENKTPGLARNSDFIARVKHILVAIGEDAVDGIVGRLDVKNQRAKTALLSLLRKIVVDPDFGNEADHWRSWYWIWAAGRRRAVATVPRLVEFLRSSDQRFRLAAARSLGQIRSREAVKPLVTILGKTGQVPLMRASIRALVRIGDETAAPAFIRLLEHDRGEVRQEAVTALRFLTHQMKGYDPGARGDQRAAAVARWWAWWDKSRR